MKDSTKGAIIVGCGLLGLVSACLLFKHFTGSAKAGEAVCKTIEKPFTGADSQRKLAETIGAASRNGYAAPFEVCEHVRRLSGGRKASAEKIASALENNIVLEETQTWVRRYMKGLGE